VWGGVKPIVVPYIPKHHENKVVDNEKGNENEKCDYDNSNVRLNCSVFNNDNVPCGDNELVFVHSVCRGMVFGLFLGFWVVTILDVYNLWRKKKKRVSKYDS